MIEILTSCIYCKVSSNEAPLLSLQYQGQTIWICPQHLPLLIHKPGQLVDILPGAEKLKPYDEGLS